MCRRTSFPQRDQPLVLPVDMRGWLPEDNLAFVVLDAVATVDLGKFRRSCCWARSFEPWTLLKPGPMTRSGKIYDLTATILKGPNSAFRRSQMKLTEALDTARLYLVNDGNDRALELLPFIRVLAGQTGQDACYFYNRLEGTEVRRVSYHFHAEPELLLPDEGLVDLLTDLGAPYFAKKESTNLVAQVSQRS